MSTPPDERTKQVFDEAIELAGEERSAVIERACGRDQVLRERVLALISAAEKDDGFLEDRTSTPCPRPDTGESGTRVGPYELREPIGEGGFGVVFRAEQLHPVRRQVALKILKAGMDTRAVVARFEQERQALAVMDHPNIARVCDAGETDTGRPYFAMELVAGEPLTTYCDRARLGIEQRLELLLQVCRAVQHAHTKGVIHRDIKPSNVLVSLQDGRPVAKVIDFGIAKATHGRLTDKTFQTELRQFLGTPEYMSPEQAEGSLDIDTRADVYALGVLLYELLSGATPFDAGALRSAGYGELQRIIREVDPPTPSTRLTRSTSGLAVVAAARRVPPHRLGSLLRGELDWIAMRALEKDRARRYQTAGELAEDIERYLRGEPVLAAPPGALYRAQKLLRRHRLGVGVGTTVATALVAGTAVALWQASLAAEQRDAAQEYATQADEARREAEARRLETEQVAQFEAQRLRQIDVPVMGRRILADIAEDARRGMQRAGIPATRVAERMGMLSELLADVNTTDIALRTLDASIFQGTRRAIDARFEGQPTLRARLLYSLGSLLTDLGLSDRAEEMLVEAVDIRREHLGDLHPETLYAILSLGLLRQHQSRFGEAEGLNREAYEGRKQILGRLHEDTLVAQNNLGIALLSLGRLADAEVVLRDLLECFLSMRRSGEPTTLEVQGNLGGLLLEQGRPGEAEPYFREAWEGLRAAYGPDSMMSLLMASNLALSLERQGRLEEAEGIYRDAMERARRVLGEEHRDTLLFKSNLGYLLCSLGRLPEAEALTLEALGIRRRLMGDEHWDTLQSVHNAGVLRAAQGDVPQAEAHFRSALSGRSSQFGADHASVTQTQRELARLLCREGRFAEAQALLLPAWDTLAASDQAGAGQRSELLRGLVELYEAWSPEDPDDERAGGLSRWRAELERLDADAVARMGGDEGDR